MDREARALERWLGGRGLTELTVVKRGKTLTIMTGTPSDPWPEVRLAWTAHNMWRLDFRHDSGGRAGWAPTPFVGDMGEMVDTAISMGRLGDSGSLPGNQGDTSDLSH